MYFNIQEPKNPLKHYIDVLEFEKILELISGHCLSEGGRKLVFSLSPIDDAQIIRERQELVEEVRQLLAISKQPDLTGLSDPEGFIEKARKEGVLTEEQLWQISQCSRLCHKICRISVQQDRFPRLRKLIEKIEITPSVHTNIERFITAPGVFKDDASEKLVQLRIAKKEIHDKLHNKLNSMLEDERYCGFWQEPLITLRNERFVLPLKAEHKQHLPSVIHDRSASGATLFIEPIEVVPLNNQMRELELEEREELQRILRNLSGIVSAYQSQLMSNLKILHQLDFLVAVARFADEFNANPPTVDPNANLSLVNARHPILMLESNNREVVPLNLSLKPNVKGVLITGPNMGGKTVALKTLGLLVLMAMCGLPIPADSRTQIPLFKTFFADIGDEQSVEASISSFASHIVHYNVALKSADENSLVLFDELGGATDPQEATPLSWAMLEALLDKGATVIANTHLGGLLGIASTRGDIINAAMEFDQQNISPTYRLLCNLPGRSWAIEIAGMLGFPEEILMRCRELSEGGIELDRIISELQARMREVEDIRRRLIEEQNEMRTKREMLEALISSNLVKEKEIRRLRRAYEEQRDNRIAAALERELEKMRHQWESIISEHPPEPQRRKKAEEYLAQIKAKLRKKEKDIAKRRGLPKKLMPGQRVFLYRLHKWADVLNETDEQGFVRVLAGNYPLRIHSSSVDTEEEYEQRRRKRDRRQREGGVSYQRREVPAKVDVRGMMPEDAWNKVDHIIDDAIASNAEKVLIVHGKGKGILRRHIRDKLHNDSRIAQLRLPDERDGGDGATIAIIAQSENEQDKQQNKSNNRQK